jgi:hypothetical protein
MFRQGILGSVSAKPRVGELIPKIKLNPIDDRSRFKGLEASALCRPTQHLIPQRDRRLAF